MSLVGYCRVSSDSQNLEAQIARLRSAGCTKVFEETMSGGSLDRPEFVKCLDFLREGDVLMAVRMDRISRASTGQTLNLLDDLTSRGIKYKFLDEPLLDTTTPMGEVMVALVAALNRVFLAQNKARQKDGIDRRKAAGGYKGRKPVIPKERVIELKDQGMGQAEIARTLKVSESSVYRILGNGAA